MTQMLRARQGEITTQMEYVATTEQVNPEFIRQEVAKGRICIPNNKNRKLPAVGIGKNLRTKVNANVGTSTQWPHKQQELKKAHMALTTGADAIMDLSTGGDLIGIRQALLEEIPLPLGTVPLYQVAVETQQKGKAITDMDIEHLFSVIKSQGEEGVDFVTLHCGLTLESAHRLQQEGRIMDVVSRGGSFLVAWMLNNNQENPLYEHFDRLLEICLQYDLTLSLGDGMRPGSIVDATDRAQIQELIILGELVDRAWQQGVQVMVEGPGHVPLDQVEMNVKLQKRLCHEAPFYVLGPLVTDIAPGYDHITAAIGGSIAASHGADFLCYVTPAEHLGLPDVQDVRDGVIASRIAAHAGDLVKGVAGAWQWDLNMSKARKALDWPEQIKLALDSQKAAAIRHEKNPAGGENCSMCGPFCAMRQVNHHLDEGDNNGASQ